MENQSRMMEKETHKNVQPDLKMSTCHFKYEQNINLIYTVRYWAESTI